MDFRDITDVELGSVGRDWAAGTGPVTFTFEHLNDVMVAANDDPHILAPRVKIGHYSPVNGDAPDYDPFTVIGDAEPAFGRVINLRLTNDGATLVGDLVEVPGWLADTMPSAYPGRSGEWFGPVETPGGKRYSCVMTALALLGVVLPALSDLEDLKRLLTSGPTIRPAPTRAATARRARNLTTRRHHAAARHGRPDQR